VKKYNIYGSVTLIVVSSLLLGIFLFSCKKEENPIRYKYGFFTDSVTIALDGINSVYDDYNTNIYQIEGGDILVFSSNRNSAGGKFDLVQGLLTYSFDQTTGALKMQHVMYDDTFTSNLLTQANSLGDDLGPYRFFSSVDGYEYLMLSSESGNGDLDLYYLKNSPAYGITLPAITGPKPVTLLNTGANEGYFSFDFQKDSAYFCSDASGDFDIYLIGCEEKNSIASWLESEYTASVQVEVVNSEYDDKCPFVYYKVMVFASNRPGGLGGFDLYYSIFEGGDWGAPINFGPEINSEYNEYRPTIGFDSEFTNKFMIFSSDRPGGKGGYDLYFRGVSFDY